MSWDVVQGLLPALSPSSWLIAPGLRGSYFPAPRAILCWFDTQVFTSRTQVAHEQRCFLARLQISLTPKPLSGWVLIALFSAHFHNFQALQALACSHSSDCPRGLLHAFAPSDADGCDGATHLTPCYHPYPSPGSNPGSCMVADFDTESVPRLAQLDCMSVIVSPLPLFRRQGSEPTDLKKSSRISGARPG
ncbi:MAG: hypothetical protein RLZZ591_1112 [Pseudomonadota bacterium]|jgi:hypothetical protein